MEVTDITQDRFELPAALSGPGNRVMIGATTAQNAPLGSQNTGLLKLPRRRTRGACVNCRSRRVRCDAVGSGVPCTNCAAFSLICTGSTRPTEKNGGVETGGVDANRNKSNPKKGQSIETMHPMQLLERHILQEADNINHLYVQFMKPELRNAPIKAPGRVAYLGESSNFPLLVDNDPSLANIVHFQLPENSQDSRVKLARMENTEIDMLRQRGALSLPAWRLCDDLVDSYFKWVAPILPVINKGRFMRQYRDPNNPPSLLLLQAVFLAGSSVYKGGTATPGMTFYKRAKALYDTGYEDDRIITIQALILIGWYWEKSGGDVGEIFYWNGLATTIAQGSGIHRSTERSPLPKVDKRLWRRIWWTLYIRDRSVALLGQVAQINTDDSDIEMVCAEDFTDDDYPSDRIQVQFFLQSVRLCMIISDILQLQSSTPLKARSHNAVASTRSKMALLGWLKTCPKELRWDESSRNFWSASLHCSYNTTLCLLHREDLRMLHVNDELGVGHSIDGPYHLLQQYYLVDAPETESGDRHAVSRNNNTVQPDGNIA